MKELEIFRHLKESQVEALKEAIPLVTVLIAGADGVIDEQELNWAEKLTKIRSFAEPESLNLFYEEAESGLISKVEKLIQELPKETDKRQREISHRLKRLNDILPLLENKVAHEIYQSLTSFAQHIAKASGGFLRFGSVSKEEKQWLNLPMVDPVILHPLDD